MRFRKLKALVATGTVFVGILALAPTTAQAAVAATQLTADSSSADGNSHTTASITPTANSLVLVTVAYSNATGTIDSVEPDVTGNGITYTEVLSGPIKNSGGSRMMLTVYRGLSASPTTGAITICFDSAPDGSDDDGSCDQSHDGAVWSVTEFAGVNTTGTNGANAVGDSAHEQDSASPYATDTIAVDADNIPFAAFSKNTNVTNNYTLEGGWSALGTPSHITLPSMTMTTGYGPAGDDDTSWTSANGNLGGQIIVEVVASSVLVSDGFGWGSGTRGSGTDLNGANTDEAFGGTNATWFVQETGNTSEESFQGLSSGVLQAPQLPPSDNANFSWGFVEVGQTNHVQVEADATLGAAGGQIGANVGLILNAGEPSSASANERKNNAWCKLEITPGTNHPNGMIQINTLADGDQTVGETDASNVQAVPAYVFSSGENHLVEGNLYHLSFSRVDDLLACTVHGPGSSGGADVNRSITWDIQDSDFYGDSSDDDPLVFLGITSGAGNAAGVRVKALITAADNNDEDQGDSSFDDFVVTDLG